MASISGPTPMIAITRFMLKAGTWRLISVLTRFKVRVKKWVEPIQALMVPYGCSTVCRRKHSIGHSVKPGLHRIEDVFVFPALDPLQLVWGTSGLEGTGEAGGQMGVIVDVLPAI